LPAAELTVATVNSDAAVKPISVDLNAVSLFMIPPRELKTVL
jgi:hypothetical protein